MVKSYYFDESQLTEGREKIAQEIVDILVKHNLSNIEANIILDIASCKKDNLRIIADYVPSIS